jgi:hypothetical protein
MLHALTTELKLDNLPNYSKVHTSQIKDACAELETQQLLSIIKKYTTADDMFTQKYLFGRNENIKLLVDLGRAVETPEKTAYMYDMLEQTDPLYVRCLVEVFRAYHDRTTDTTAAAPDNSPAPADEAPD